MTDPTPMKPSTVAAVPDPKKLEEAASKINTEYEAILAQDKQMKTMGDNIVRRAIAVGDMLLTVKEAVGHGNWLPWLKTNCPNIEERTAQRWMGLAEKKEVLAERMKSDTMSDLTLKRALDLCNEKERKKKNGSSTEKETITYAKVTDAKSALNAYTALEQHLLDALEDVNGRSSFAHADEYAQRTIEKLQEKLNVMQQPQKEEQKAA
jgi:hypothetical protein